MKGIILAGGLGTRLYPATKITNKQLLPIYDKPLIYYPLNVLMLAGIREILIISTPQHLPCFKEMLGDGSRLGIKLEYAQQDAPNGIPEAFTIGKAFIGEDDVTLILGDNLFYGNKMTSTITEAIQNNQGATIFGTRVKDPERFGVIEFDQNSNKVRSLEEKPTQPKSPFACIGLYIFKNDVVNFVSQLKPSYRGELEMVDLLNLYLKQDRLNVSTLYRGTVWLDTGTRDSMLEASQFIKIVQEQKGQYVACLEETAHEMGFIDTKHLFKIVVELPQSDYKSYLLVYLQELSKREGIV